MENIHVWKILITCSFQIFKGIMKRYPHLSAWSADLFPADRFSFTSPQDPQISTVLLPPAVSHSLVSVRLHPQSMRSPLRPWTEFQNANMASIAGLGSKRLKNNSLQFLNLDRTNQACCFTTELGVYQLCLSWQHNGKASKRRNPRSLVGNNLSQQDNAPTENVLFV